MKIHLINDGVSRPVDALITARIREGLDSEFTLSFTLTENDTPYIHDNTVVQYGEQYFNVVSYQKDREGRSPTCAAECEHVSYCLNDEAYELEEFVYSGSAAGALKAVLNGTPLSAGTVELSGTVNIRLTGGTRKAILLSVAAIIGGEIEYSGYTVNLRGHRGSTDYIELLGTDNVTDVSYSRDVLNGTMAYNVQLGRKTILSCGDNVHIRFTPLEIDVQTRITAIEYNPYNTNEVEIEVGDYVPDILDSLQKTQDRADAATKDAETAKKTASETAASLSEYTKKSEISAEVNKYLDSETGQASIVASLSGTYVTADKLSGYVEKTELSAEIGAYIDTEAGTAKIVNKLTGTFVKTDALGNYVAKSDLSAGIESYIDTEAGTAKVVSAVSGTYVTQSGLTGTLGNYAQKGDIPDVSGFVEKTELSAEIGAYIDTQAGTAKIVDKLTGTFVKTDALGNYVAKSDLSAGIESYINTSTGQAKLVSAVSGTYVTQSGLTGTLGNYAQKGDIPDVSGFVEKTELSAEIGAYIDTQAGTAKIVDKLTGTFVKEDSLGNYVEKKELSAEIGAYIDTSAGTAKIISAASGTYQKKSDMSGYVTTTNLNTSIGQYIDSTAGTAKIVSACSGEFLTESDLSGYAKTSALTSIEQSVSNVEAAITLSSSYTKNTIGTNVYALLQLVSNPNSSNIKIQADKIDFTGFTTFLRASDLGSSGSTSIDGGRIKTGTISADRIDTSSITLSDVYGKGTYASYLMITSSGHYMYIGSDITTTKGVYESIDIRSETLGFSNVSTRGLVMDHANKVFRPNSSSATGGYSLGTSTYQWNNLYVNKIYLGGKELTAGASMAGSSVTMGGSTSYYIVCNTSRELRPYSTSTTYPCYLGTSSYYWHYAYIGSNTASIGSSASSKIGFFGTTPAIRQTVSNTATVATLITALKKYGLIA